MREIRPLRVRKIWSDNRHNAFTSLTGFKGKLFLAFRSGTTHMTRDGAIRILTSSDTGETWQSAAFIVKENCDLRDPRIIELNGVLHVFCLFSGQDGSHGSYHMTSSDGVNFSEPRLIADMGSGMIWGIAKFNGKIYGTDYYRISEANFRPRLYVSSDGDKWEKLMDFPMPGTEVALDFDADGYLYTFIRDSAYGCGMVPTVARLSPPYTGLPEQNAKTMHIVKALPLKMVGPMIKRLDGASLLIGRCWVGRECRFPRTDAYILEDGKDPEYCFSLPSGGDTSYASYWEIAPGRALVSYYSSHEHRIDFPVDDRSGRKAEHNTYADIYLAEISHSYIGEEK
jgi:hypothetical protein